MPSSDDTIRSFAQKLSAYAETLPHEERALLEHVFLTAIGPHERLRLFPPNELLADAERELLDCLAQPKE
ncbi:hypothetical protein QTI66_38790 [Variovorax sp. J22R133]|uniref:hypothetical protein n=1 Tax=Variovorax brevis TaxID=3053503 RepID=UPI002578CDCC|nr:hypothetical protein [Variovorax sp. J22R133]MDM0118030.1 hypothetical protein [Variovorax sp. J22R133]